jgi:hypothetical protein
MDSKRRGGRVAKQPTKNPVKRKKVSNDPAINHIKRGVARLKSIGKAFGLLVPGVGGSMLTRKATNALKKVNSGYYK